MIIIKIIRALRQAQEEEAQATADLRNYLANIPASAEEDIQALYTYMLICGD